MGSSSDLSPSLLSSTERTERTRHGSFDDNKQGIERSPDDELLSLCDAYRFNSGGDIQKMNASAAAAAAADNKDVNTADHHGSTSFQNTSHTSVHHETHTNHPSDGAEHCFVVKTSSVEKPTSHPSNAPKPDICSDETGNPVSGRRSIDDTTKEVICCDQIQRQEEKQTQEGDQTNQIQEPQTIQTAPNANSRAIMGVSMPSGAFNHFLCADAVGHENVISTQSKLATSTKSNDSHYSPSAYKGTFKILGSTAYDAKIQHNQNEYFLGSYQLVSDAALAYDRAAALLKGPFCIRNFNTPGDYLGARRNEMMQRGIAVKYAEGPYTAIERIGLYLQQIQNGMFDVFICGLLHHQPIVLIFSTFPRQKLPYNNQSKRKSHQHTKVCTNHLGKPITKLRYPTTKRP
jgi:hypothetical protein